MLNKIIYLYIILLTSGAYAQEIDCNIIINTDALGATATTSDKEIYRTMESEFSYFMNNTRWTEDRFETEELISCNILISVTKRPSINTFSCTAQIQSSRPVYNSNYESLMFNFIDKNFNYIYNENQPLEFNENGYTNEITSILAYYAYIIIGMDYDSFEKRGGTIYFEKARDIVNNAQQFGGSGWSSSSSDTKNRFSLVDNLTNQQLLPFRDEMYSYHRLGFDTFHENIKGAQTKMLNTLKIIRGVRRIVPVSVLIDAFFDAKAEELVKVFKGSDQKTKLQAFALLKMLDPTNTNNYQEIIK